MYCSECGKKIQENSKFCSNCGAKQTVKETIEPGIPEAPQQVFADPVNLVAFRPSRAAIRIYFVWVTIHIVILLLTKTDTDALQSGSPDKASFWPFTSQFFAGKSSMTGLEYSCQTYDSISGKAKPCFYGVFADYDISELLIYSLIPVIIFVFKRLSNGGLRQ